ncbi:hypothetical protein CCICO_10760 [Corynebacterium ciconiae DSM 44920]|nr:hypothetical protein CCICO_10760 [Corynebacterium ciconiae DSM 44920]
MCAHVSSSRTLFRFAPALGMCETAQPTQGLLAPIATRPYPAKWNTPFRNGSS